MSLNIGSGINNYNALFASMQKSGNQKSKANTQYDFATMGTVRNAVIQQKAKDNMSSRLGRTDAEIPTHDKKVTWYGVDITENPDVYKEIVPISDDIKKDIFENVKKDFETTGIRSKEDLSLMENFYKKCDKVVSSMKGMDKLKTSWTMSQYRTSVHNAIESKIRTLDPKWDWGQPVKKEVLNQVFGKKLDVSV